MNKTQRSLTLLNYLTQFEKNIKIHSAVVIIFITSKLI